MRVISRPSQLNGDITVPASKSHTIRAVIIGALANGESVIEGPLESLDTKSAADAVRAFGALIDAGADRWTIRGVGGNPHVPDNVIDVGNSGTTLYMIMGTASLAEGWTVLTGDDQIRRRTAAPLIEALNGLGAQVLSTRGTGMAPVMVKGRMTGGMTSVAGISSQYLSSLLLSCPLAPGDSEITVTQLNERPYVRMTLGWLDYEGICYDMNESMSRVTIPGGQAYRPFSRTIPGDFSSAAFPLCAAAIAGGTVRVHRLDMYDVQGDKRVVDILAGMGAVVKREAGSVSVTGVSLKGIDVDMNEIPDVLPMLAVTACFAEGKTVLYNVAQARIKETDRIAVMAGELAKLGASVKEMPDGLEITGTGLRGGIVRGHGDHRVVMAMAVAGLAADGEVTVDTAESAEVTFPGFWEKMRSLGAELEIH